MATKTKMTVNKVVPPKKQVTTTTTKQVRPGTKEGEQAKKNADAYNAQIKALIGTINPKTGKPHTKESATYTIQYNKGTAVRNQYRKS